MLSISPVTFPSPVVAGKQFTITVDCGTGDYVELDISVDGTAQVQDHAASFGQGGIIGSRLYTLTVANPGDHILTATGWVDTVNKYVSAPLTVHVHAAAPPEFTVHAPVAGATVDLDEGGGQVVVDLTTTSTYYPLNTRVICNGRPAFMWAFEHFSSPHYQRTVTLAPAPLGPQTIQVGVFDPDGLGVFQTFSVMGRDVAPPHVQVPSAGANIVGDVNGAVTVPLAGTAFDAQSGMVGGAATVQWALTPTGPRTAAYAVTGSDFTNWSANIPLAGFGAHTIYVWATDNAGNTMPIPLNVPVVVISSYVPATLADRLDEREYLAALLSFTSDQVTTTGTTHADTAAVVNVLGQLLDRLSQPLSQEADRGGQEINELRIPIELLRTYISSTHTSTAPGAAGETEYLNAAYTNLLTAIGTSYQELRLARGATPNDQQALATRLGVPLAALNQLILDDNNLTEQALQTLFGLTATTTTDPLAAPSTPQILTWQLTEQAQIWAAQDQHPNQPQAFAVLADPDVITADAVAAGPNGDPIRALLTQRATQLSSFATQLDTLRSANAANPTAALIAMLNQTLPGVDLAQLETQDGQGVDISGALQSAGLTRAGFLYLRTFNRLASAGPVTPAEWTDAIAVLTNAFKRHQYPSWRAQETGFVLSPDFFVHPVATPQVNRYRDDPQSRHDWLAVLTTRIAQRQDLIDGNAAAIAATEQAALPILRDALLTDIAPTLSGDTGEAMSTRFFVDMLAGGSVRTTRIRQAIEGLQSLLVAIRAAELPGSHPAAAWKLGDNSAAAVSAFTDAWRWMGELGSWQAATMAFLFPERHLDPSLLLSFPSGTFGQPSAALHTLHSAIAGSGPFSAADAVSAATTCAQSLNVTLPAGGYLNPGKDPTHQTAVSTSITTALFVDPREAAWAVPLLLAQRLQSAGDFQSALDWYWIVYPYDVDTGGTGMPTSIFGTITSETTVQPDLTFPPDWTTKLNPFTLIAGRPYPYTRYTLLCIIRCHLDYADAEFTRETDESIAHARTLYVTARKLLGAAALQPQTPKNPGEPMLAIPELDALRARAETQLAKLRQGRNIAGMRRTQPFGTPAVTQPTPYRFKTLLERAKQIAAQAAQIEAGYLAALEKYDQKNLALFDAQKAVQLNAAQVTLAQSRVDEATDAVKAATAQQAKADTMVQTYTDATNAPPNQYEQNLLDEYPQMRDVRDGIAAADTAIGIMQAASKASSLWDAVTTFGASTAFSGGIIAATAIKGGLEVWQNDLEAQMQANQLQAGIEQRRAEWRIQQTAAQQDSLVAAAQVTVAKDQVTIATQEQDIANLQNNQAAATLNFLNNQFTNPDLYQWMSVTLGGVYRYFLQQATATARLAQAQLAFERADQQQTLIRTDYWQSPAELTANGGQSDRGGLTGAEQLSADLSQLDDYAFSTEQRRLNLSQTFSLARLMPVEFLEFRRTGTLPFATPMALFDADFPGHYLRLIRQVRTSVVALIPPDRGIRATLYCNSISRVTSRSNGNAPSGLMSASFQDIVLRHDPAVVALTSPIGATGVFDLDTQPDMLLPFESSGVDTTWELQLPPAANPFDFSTIADVLITIDYTAVYDDDYRTQTIARLNANRDRGADCVFSMASDFPDQWYQLNNPIDPNARRVTITLRNVDFPVGIENITSAAIAVQLAGSDSSTPLGATTVSLQRGPAGGTATTTDGIASTRRGNAASWIPLCGTSPTGDWQLSFGSDATSLFGTSTSGLDDILLVISWVGQAPAWVP